MANTIQIKRGLKSALPILSSGEPGFCTDTHEFYIGDGTTNYRFLSSSANLSDINNVVTARSNLGVDAAGTINYTHPTYTAFTESGDTTALTGATVISDLDFNITTDSLGHVTACDITTLATRTLTLADLGYTGDTNAQANVATNISWTAGTTAGPICNSSTGTDAAIPVASATASGVVNTTTQTFAGVKTFSSTITGNISGNAATVTNGVYTSRTISTTSPLTGGGNLSANRTISIPAATASVDGYMTSTYASKLDDIAASANNYSHPTHPGDDFSVDTGALTGAVVVSDIDINVTTDTLGHVTDANGTVSTRTLTLADLGYTGATNANYYTHPTYTAFTETGDTGPLTGATVISDLDFNITTDTSGHVTSCDITTITTRNLTKSDIGLGNVPNLDFSNASNITSGTISSSVLPPLALTDVFSVATEVAQLALTAQEGDVAIRSDISTTYIHNGGTAGTMADWSELSTPLDGVTSVNGYTGPSVTLSQDDVGNGTTYVRTTNDFTDTLLSKLNGIASSANNYSHPTYTARTESADTGPLTGATVISDLDFNITTDTSGHVTACDITTLATRNLTLADLGYSGATNANYYTLPVASTTLGGVKSGTDITVDGSGNVSVNDDSHAHVISNIDGLQDALIDAGGGLTWSIISTNTTASNKQGYLINVSSSSINLTLPLSPTEGDTVGVCDYYSNSSTNNITIVRNGQNIEGSAEDLVINLDGAGLTLVFTDATRGWEIVSEIPSPNQLINDPNPQLAANLDLNGYSIEFPSTTISDVLDEDDMMSNSNTKLATQQSIKSYITSSISAHSDLTTDTHGAGTNTILHSGSIIDGGNF